MYSVPYIINTFIKSWMFYITLGSILFFIAIICVVVYIRKLSAITTSDIDLENNKLYLISLEKKVADVRSEKEILERELERKNKKLSDKVLYHADRDVLICEMMAYLCSSTKFKRDTRLTGYIQSIKSKIATGNEWDSLVMHFDAINQGSLQRLKIRHPALTSNDIRFLAYFYMNLNAKEIAKVLNITVVASKKRKERIIQKMGLCKDVDLFNYLIEI